MILIGDVHRFKVRFKVCFNVRFKVCFKVCLKVRFKVRFKVRCDSIVYNCSTRLIRKHLSSGIYKDPLNTKTKPLKIDQIHKFYVLC